MGIFSFLHYCKKTKQNKKTSSFFSSWIIYPRICYYKSYLYSRLHLRWKRPTMYCSKLLAVFKKCAKVFWLEVFCRDKAAHSSLNPVTDWDSRCKYLMRSWYSKGQVIRSVNFHWCPLINCPLSSRWPRETWKKTWKPLCLPHRTALQSGAEMYAGLTES